MEASYSPSEVRNRIGRNPDASFEVARGTDTETVEATPNMVHYGSYTRGPLVRLSYNKYHAFLPPWHDLVSFTLMGNETAEFAVLEHLDTLVTGELKTVDIAARTVSFDT